MTKYLVLGQTPTTSSYELRVYKSRWQFRLFQEQSYFECQTTLCIPLKAIRDCQRVHVAIPRSRSCQREENEKKYQFEVYLKDEPSLNVKEEPVP
jgi:hypothetical protein